MFPQDFIWGGATSPHQVEGNNVLSDWWRLEHSESWPLERSGDACDHYHRFAEDIDLLARAGLTCHRFGIEWARVEPAPGEFSRAELAHYRSVIDATLDAGMTPVVTLHHFTVPAWFADRGGWLGPDAVADFTRYVSAVAPILADVPWVATINEPNMVAEMVSVAAAGGDFSAHPLPDDATTDVLIAAHRAAVEILHGETGASLEWTVAQQAFTPREGAEDQWARISRAWEDRYLEVSGDDDFLGVQVYTSRQIGMEGIIEPDPSPDNTLNGWAYRPDAMGIALRHAHDVTNGTPLLITENGIATSDDTRRIAYTATALSHVAEAVSEGIDIRGYIHWSALDNFEWGSWTPTFGLVAVDRETFERRPKPSLAWLGAVARDNGRWIAPLH